MKKRSHISDEEITVKKAEEYTICIHGTYWKAWEGMGQEHLKIFVKFFIIFQDLKF